MEIGKIFLFEAAFFGDRYRQRVAQSEHGCSRRSGSEAQRARLLGNGTVERNIGGGGERREPPTVSVIEAVAGHRNEGNTQAFDSREQSEDFLGFAAGGEGDYKVPLHNHSEVAVDCFGRMQKQSRGAGGTEGSGYFPGHDSAFSHSRHDDASVAAEE